MIQQLGASLSIIVLTTLKRSFMLLELSIVLLDLSKLLLELSIILLKLSNYAPREHL